VAVIAGLFLATLALRPQLLAIGPLLPLIREDLGLSASAAGFLTTIPVLCMGVFAPIGPFVAARLGPKTAFGICLALVVGLGMVRAVAPSYPLVLLATLGLGIGVGVAGAIPSMIVSQRLPSRPALGTGAYAGGIVAGSTLAAAAAVPLAINGDWRQSLLVISAISLVSVGAWFALVRGDRPPGAIRVTVPHLPWRHVTAWLLVAAFGLQSLMYYGVVAWLPNVFVERGWTPAAAGSLVAVCNGVGLVTTLGVPLVADRFGGRRRQLVGSACSTAATAIVLFPTFARSAAVWACSRSIFRSCDPAADATDEPPAVARAAPAARWLPFPLWPVRAGCSQTPSNFEASLRILVVVGVALVGCCLCLADRSSRIYTPCIGAPSNVAEVCDAPSLTPAWMAGSPDGRSHGATRVRRSVPQLPGPGA
jgi:CP family cyanate transporter-like MFS transporter